MSTTRRQRPRYQKGCVQRRTRGSHDVWIFRWRDETGQAKCETLGTALQLPTKKDALRKAAGKLLAINSECQRPELTTFGAVIDRYENEEMPRRHSTKSGYKPWLKNHVRPKWGDYLIQDVRTDAVEKWLTSLALSGKSKGHIRSLMKIVFDCAVRWELIEKNPIWHNGHHLVRVKGISKRLEQPKVLTFDECKRVLEALHEPHRTMATVAMCLGLRVSEILGLQWDDFDWEDGHVYVQRSVVVGREDQTKTVGSEKRLPLDSLLAEELKRYRSQWQMPGVPWVFLNPDTERPWMAHTIQQNYLVQAGEAAKVGWIGWHTFRHSYSTQLRMLGVDVKVQQELLRHADIRTTMNGYTQAVSGQLREAHGRVVGNLLQMPERTA